MKRGAGPVGAAPGIIETADPTGIRFRFGKIQERA